MTLTINERYYIVIQEKLRRERDGFKEMVKGLDSSRAWRNNKKSLYDIEKGLIKKGYSKTRITEILNEIQKRELYLLN